jgi:hypothetical protein
VRGNGVRGSGGRGNGVRGSGDISLWERSVGMPGSSGGGRSATVTLRAPAPTARSPAAIAGPATGTRGAWMRAQA